PPGTDARTRASLQQHHPQGIDREGVSEAVGTAFRAARAPVPGGAAGTRPRQENGEHVLFRMMEAKGVMVPRDFSERPVCGIHMSPNRDPAGRTTGPTAAAYAVHGALRWPGARYYAQ